MIVHSSKNPIIIKEASSNQVIEENKTTIKKIVDKIFPTACRILDKVTKESGFKYLCEKKYSLPNNVDCYMLPDPNGKYDNFYNVYEDHVYYFGMITLFVVSTDKAYNNNDKDEYNEFDWNKWEDSIFKLCSELNSNKEISKYGKVFTDQPDDGGQIYFKINKDLLNTNSEEVKKTGLDSLSDIQRKKLINNLDKISKSIYKEFKEEFEKDESIQGKLHPIHYDYYTGKYAWTFYFSNNKKATEKEEIPSDLKQKFDSIMTKLVNEYNNKYGGNIKYEITTRERYWITWLIIKFNITDDTYTNFLK